MKWHHFDFYFSYFPSTISHGTSPIRIPSQTTVAATVDVTSASCRLQSTMQQGIPDQGSLGPTILFMPAGNISRRLSERIPIKLIGPYRTPSLMRLKSQHKCFG